jgi:hypothetical protein
MSISEISGTVSETVVMGGPTYDENLTVDANDPMDGTDGVIAPTSGDGIDTVATLDASDIFLNNQGSITGGSLANGDGAVGANFAFGISQLTNAGMIAGGTSSTGTGGAGVAITASAPDQYGEQYGYAFNDGTIAGGDGATTGGAGIVLNAGAVLDNGFSGIVKGGDGTNGGDGGDGAILNAGGFIENDNTITGGSGTHGGTGIVMDGGSLENFGTISGGNGTTGLGTGVLLEGGATIYVAGTIQGGVIGDPTYGDSVDFGAGGGTLDIDGSSTVLNGSIGGFAAGDTINFSDATNVSVTSANGTSATISYTTASGTETLNLLGNFSGGNLQVNDGTVTACYVRGTRIRTPEGDQAIESLTLGSNVLTASGEARRVRWLGHRAVQCSAHPDPSGVWPVLIAAHAFADNVPARDLWTSPGHSILFEGSLIQARNLINGVTVRQVPMHRVEYWHLELETHDVILAEGLPAETYLDTGNRTAFENGGAFLELHPRFEPKHWAVTCHPLELDGPKVTQAREQLLKRVHELGYRIVDEPGAHLDVDGRRIEPVKLTERRLAFALPENAASVVLCSRTFVPGHIDANSRDDRALGLCVSRLQVDGTDVALDDDVFLGAGWHELESYGADRRQRWTKACTPLPGGIRLVVIDLCSRGYYRVPPAATQSTLSALPALSRRPPRS